MMKRADQKYGLSAKSFLLIIALLITVAFTSVTAFAAASIKDIEYKGKGKVEVEFDSPVHYCRTELVVKDSSGERYDTEITAKEKTKFKFTIKNYRKGYTYTFKIKRVRKEGESSYETVKGKFKIYKTVHGITFREIEYENDEKELDFEFLHKVQFKNLTVSVMAGGKEYVKKIHNIENDEIELKVKPMKKGKKYKYKIIGIRKKGNRKFITLQGTFRA